MVASDKQICEEALALLRQETPLDASRLTAQTEADGTTKAERACRRVYDSARRAFLSMHDWNAARTSKSFTVPANRSYAINATNAPGLLRVVDVLDSSSEGVRHKVSNGTIHRIALEEDASATLLYTRDIDGSSASPAPADWPPLMRSAFTAYLARELAIPVSGRREDAQLADALYKERLVDARRADLNEGDPMDDLAREIFASLVDGCHPQGDGLVDSIEACSRRIGVFKTSAMEEIRAAHAWTMNSATSTETIGGVEYAVTTNERAVAWTDKTAQNDTSRTKTVSKPNRLVRAAAVTLAAAKIAAHVGLPADGVAALRKLYETQLARAKAEDLNYNLRTNSDPLLAELLADFRRDPDALADAYAAYSQRGATALAAAKEEVAATLGLANAAAVASDKLANAAAVCLAAANLAH
ncbi:MAG: hypothetical protein IJQ73_11200, partial [Kiritimatiellae bacterium]|nr:hypothetical protein [Kiritimatiellia bacterium]